MRRRRNAERNGNQKFKDSSDRSDEKGSSQSIGIKYFRQNGTLTDKAVAEVQMANVDNPIKITADDILSQHDKSQILLDAQQILAKYNTKEIIIREDGVYLGSGSANEPAVLGNQLATLLVDWLGALSQMMTPTMMGPQPPANLAKFVSLQAKVNSYKASISGFLSKTVKVAE